MEEASMYKVPTIDFSAKSFLILSQLGIFAVFAYWALSGPDDWATYVFFAMMSASGLALFLSVPNARMGVTLGVPAIMIVMALALGEYDMAFWAVFMVIMLGSIAYLPAMAIGDETLGLDDETRMKRLGVLWTVFTLFMVLMMGQLAGLALDGEATEEDNDGEKFTIVLDSDQQTIAQAGLGMAVAGVLIFLLTGLMGRELGPLVPWHGGAIVATAMGIVQYLWTVAEGAISQGVADHAFILFIASIIALTPCVAYGKK